MTKSCPNLRKVKRYAIGTMGLGDFLEHPGDGRLHPQISAQNLVWGQVASHLVSHASFHSVERLMQCGAVRSLGLTQSFREDSLAYFNERVDPQVARQALAATAKRAKRNKAFRGHVRVGLAIDGTGAGRCRSVKKLCKFCRPFSDAEGNVVGHRHELVMVTVAGVDISLPLDVEPYGQGDSELAGGMRLLERSIGMLGRRFADYVVADAKYAAAPFLNKVAELGLRAIVRLKENLPDLHGRATVRFNSRLRDEVIDYDGVEVEIWDDETLLPWDGLGWPFVRVLRYRYLSRKGDRVDAYWLTSYTKAEVSSAALFRLAKSRWEIENEGFNDAKNRYGLEHICHHEANSLVVGWLFLLLSLAIERLFRLCYLRRGSHPHCTAADLRERLYLALGRPVAHDTS